MAAGAPRTDLDDLTVEAEMMKAEAKRVVKDARLVVQMTARHLERLQELQTEEVTSDE
jgi:precorrin-6B methylase 1